MSTSDDSRHEPLFGGKLLLDIHDLSRLLNRSIPGLIRDDKAGRLPRAVKIGGGKKWNTLQVLTWIEDGCPARTLGGGKR